MWTSCSSIKRLNEEGEQKSKRAIQCHSENHIIKIPRTKFWSKLETRDYPCSLWKGNQLYTQRWKTPMVFYWMPQRLLVCSPLQEKKAHFKRSAARMAMHEMPSTLKRMTIKRRQKVGGGGWNVLPGMQKRHAIFTHTPLLLQPCMLYPPTHPVAF